MAALRPVLLIGLIALLSAAAAPPARAGLTDSIKKAAQKKIEKAAEKKAEGEAEPAPESAGEAAAPTAAVSTVSTKFDFVPGDKVLLYDDFSQDELGEFPGRWKLAAGTVEVAEMDGEHWVRLASDYARIRPKLPELKTLPEYWTLEFDIHTVAPPTTAFAISGFTDSGVAAWKVELLQYGGNIVTYQSGATTAQATYEAAPSMVGRHHVMVMARGMALKVYVDTQRMVNVPEYATTWGTAAEVQIDLLATSCQAKITNVRFAEGNKPAKDPFVDGKLVTYGIYFDSGSDVVKPESAPVLRQIAAYLEANPALRLGITGHTDSQGQPAANLDLSQRRAASVAGVLAEQFKIALDRFQSDGRGDTQAVASNASAEGRAMNRRVEFAKL
jgi:OOP family OmpA-OmpF porin